MFNLDHLTSYVEGLLTFEFAKKGSDVWTIWTKKVIGTHDANLKYNTKGNIVCGDLNAKSAIEPDFIESDIFDRHILL